MYEILKAHDNVHYIFPLTNYIKQQIQEILLSLGATKCHYNWTLALKNFDLSKCDLDKVSALTLVYLVAGITKINRIICTL